MPGTRVKILADLEAWALNDSEIKAYWLVGMAGTGKSTIAQSFCEILDRKNILGASFFCSRTSKKSRDACLIVPAIAHALTRASPSIKCKVVKTIEDDRDLAEPTYGNLDHQFQKLIYQPIRNSVRQSVSKIIVIDGADECTDLQFIYSLIRLILGSISKIPLKIFISSQGNDLIHSAFDSHANLVTTFELHDVEKHVVEDDIRKYIVSSLLDIKSLGLDHTPDAWPSPSELSTLLGRSGKLFIYAATAIRYIRNGGVHYKSRLSAMANQDSKSESKLQTGIIDDLYGHLLKEACAEKEEREVIQLRNLVSIVVFLRNPLPIHAILSLSELNAPLHLSPLTSVIYIPTAQDAAVAPFHASFPYFVTDSTRCSHTRCPSFHALVAAEGHELLALKCLELMNRSLDYNICRVPDELTFSGRGRCNMVGCDSSISQALKYSCVYWASHIADARQMQGGLMEALDEFLQKHLLHWMECLSVLGELRTAFESFRNVATALSVSSLELHKILC
jgi:hypothetical protein